MKKQRARKAEAEERQHKDILAAPPVQTEQPQRNAAEALLSRVIHKANQGDREALASLRRFLDRHDWIWRRAGDLNTATERSWIDLLAGNDQLVAESVKRTIDEMRSDLAGPAPSRMESLIVDQIINCYLACQFADTQLASLATGSVALSAFKLRRGEISQKRLLCAMRTLDLLRTTGSGGLIPNRQLRLHEPEPKKLA